jgi:lipopolysaccharide export system protein LptA
VKDTDRSVRAEGAVRASVRRKSAAGDRPTETVNLSGDRLTHKEADRILTLDGNAAVVSGAWSLASEILDIRLSPAREIESGDARGKVVVEDRATRRRGEGKHATWETRGETVVLEGDPATAIDGKGNRLTGARLTFRQGQSRVDVESKPGVGSEGWFRPEGS